MKERKDQNEKIKELTEKLQAGIQELHDSEKYRDYLRTMAKFHHYSFNNSLLIWAQRPDATAVAGYRAWQTKFGRTVNPGAKGIMIYEPSSYKRTLREVVTDEDGNPVLDKDGNKVTRAVEKTFPTFKVGYVFDCSDTSGRPLPSIVSILDRDVDNFDSVMAALQKISPAPIRFADFDGRLHQIYPHRGKDSGHCPLLGGERDGRSAQVGHHPVHLFHRAGDELLHQLRLCQGIFAHAPHHPHGSALRHRAAALCHGLRLR